MGAAGAIALLGSGGVAAAQTKLRDRDLTRARLTGPNGEYAITISAPRDARTPGDPVFYILDGDAWFGASIDVARAAEFEGFPAPILVGVGYPSGSFLDIRRREFDLTPPGATNALMTAQGIAQGGSEGLFTFLEQTLKPWVRSHYAVDRSRENLFGHSLGGLFALGTLFRYPQAYHGYIVASPSIWFGNKLVLNDEAAFERRTELKKDIRILVSVGEFEQALDRAGEADIEHYYRVHPDELQGKTVEQAMADMREDLRTSAMVDNARALAGRLRQSGFNAEFALICHEDHLMAAIGALNVGIPAMLRS